MTYIIGLAGPGKVGKSTTAKKLIKSFKKLYPKLTTIQYAFATPIYEICSYITGWSIEKLKDLEYKEVEWILETSPLPCLVGFSPRILLQRVGTECFRDNIHKNFWLDLAISKISSYDIAIIEDARFINEFEKCNCLLELERTGIYYLENHPSAMKPPQHFINKTVKIDDINFNPDELVEWIMSPERI